MSASIAQEFQQISSANPQPPLYYIEFNNSAAGVAGNAPQKNLIIGQSINTVAAVATYVPSAMWAANYFGAGSQLALMAAKVYANDNEAQLWAYPLADANSSAAAAGSIAFTGPATANGTIFLMVNGRELQVGVISGMTAQQIATAVVAAVTAYIDPRGMVLPATAAIDGTHNYQVDFTARNKGTIGNTIGLTLNFYGSANGEVLPAGVGATVVAMTGGATDPDLAGVAAALGPVAYDFIAEAGYNESTQLNELQTMMSFTSGRWSYAQQLYGHVWSAYQSTAGFSGSDLLTFGATRNDPHLTVVGYEQACPHATFDIAAANMASFGAGSKAGVSQPEQTLPLVDILAAPYGNRFLFATQTALLQTGIALMMPNNDNSASIMASVTTYQLNTWGQTDRSYLYATTMFQFMYYVRDQKANLTQKFPRAVLAADGTSFGQQGNFGTNTPTIVTPKVMESELIAEYARMCPGGDLQCVVQAANDYGPQCQINGANPNRMDVLDNPIMVGGLRMIAVINQFRLVVPPTPIAA
jgi:phage tail sheath gpL-like